MQNVAAKSAAKLISDAAQHGKYKAQMLTVSKFERGSLVKRLLKFHYGYSFGEADRLVRLRKLHIVRHANGKRERVKDVKDVLEEGD